MAIDLDRLMDVVRRIFPGFWQVVHTIGDGVLNQTSPAPAAGVDSYINSRIGMSQHSTADRAFDGERSVLHLASVSHTGEFASLSTQEITVLGYVAEGFQRTKR